MLNCEFLYLNTFLANSEVLDDFKGWGLVIRRTDPKFKFDLLKDVFQVRFEFFNIHLFVSRNGILAKKSNGNISVSHAKSHPMNAIS